MSDVQEAIREARTEIAATSYTPYRGRARGVSSYRPARSIVVTACANYERWRGNDCREAWPVSRFAWCGFCLEAAK